MGTLFDQPERNRCAVESGNLEDLLSSAVELSKKHNVTVSDVIAANRVLELKRANDLYIRNCDVLDEQLAGFGELLQRLISAVECLHESAE